MSWRLKLRCPQFHVRHVFGFEWQEVCAVVEGVVGGFWCVFWEKPCMSVRVLRASFMILLGYAGNCCWRVVCMGGMFFVMFVLMKSYNSLVMCYGV